MAHGYVLAGEGSQARGAYEKFLALWKTADPDLRVLRQAQKEYAKLR
jgi:eukaryotic-like serine/threonine-protein kinase